MNTEQLKEQAERLEDYIDGGTVKEKGWGLCGNVLLDNFPSYDVFPSWELYSGEWDYPVGTAYDDYKRTVSKHDRRTTYGKQRLSLAKHCLAWCEKELKDTV